MENIASPESLPLPLSEDNMSNITEHDFESNSEISNVLFHEENTKKGGRKKILTEKGRSFQLEIKKKDRTAAHSGMSKEIKKLLSLLGQKSSIEELEKERDILDLKKDSVNTAYVAYGEICTKDEELEECQKWFDMCDTEYQECRMKLCDKIHNLERDLLDMKSKRSSKLSVSSKESSSSVLSRRAKAAAKKAKLEVEMKYLAQESEFKKLQLLKEIDKADAEENAMKQILEDIENTDDNKVNLQQMKCSDSKNENHPEILPSNSPVNQNSVKIEQTANVQTNLNQPEATQNGLNPNAISFQSNTACTSTGLSEAILQQLIQLQTKQTELSTLMVEQQKLNSLPTKEPPIFNGNYFDFPIFITAFEAIIEMRVSDPKSRLYYLDKYTSGKANDLIKGFITLSSNDGYKKAKKLLTQRFGDPHRVSDTYKTNLKNWPRVNEGDSAGLQAFADFLTRCEEAMLTMKFMDDLNSSDFLRKIVVKLPSYCSIKWCRHAFNIKKSSGEPAKFKDFVKYVKEEADLAVDPVFSPDFIRAERKKIHRGPEIFKPTDKKPYQKANSFVTSINPRSASTNDVPSLIQSPSRSFPCPLCSKDHRLDDCYEFKKRTMEDRKEIVKSKRLCFGCLRNGHISKNCRNRLTCKECGKRHPTSLHYRKDTADEAVIRCVSSKQSSAVNSMIIPVWLHHKGNPQNKIMVYALLDDASDSTFVDKKTLDDLSLKGQETQLSLTTMLGKETIFTQKVEDLVVQGVDEKYEIELPKAYSKDKIPSRRNQIPRPETAAKWSHLRKIADKVHPYKEELNVGLLIGCNCPKAIKPREVILGDGDDPYAIRTLLGWGIIGPVDATTFGDVGDDCNGACFRVMTREIGSEEISSQRFVPMNQTKEEINPTEINKMFAMEFSEKKTYESVLSQEDKKFMKIVEEGIHKCEDGHYEIPLPLRNSNVKLPDNREVAKKRLDQLKRKFDKDRKYKEDYVNFMNDVISKGYAEKVKDAEESNSSSKETQTWYIPHHGVYNPKKPGKIRVVFDCSAEVNGQSLNKHLLQGPDLTNSLVGVLTRFRQEKIAFMCDIEAMFHQVKVTESCRDLLRFFWWEDGDSSKQPTEFRMTVHLFGATSSPGCCNFALKNTAKDNEIEFGSETANFLRQDFYVDDGLKSVQTVEEAISLIKKIKLMCQNAGFNLHKFISNSKDVIEAIPSEDRAKGIKNLDLDYEPLPIERALGVQWCIEVDAFQFHITLKDRPFTRRGILSTITSIYDPLGFAAPVLLTGKRILQSLCKDKVEWDDPIPEDVRIEWQEWRNNLHLLEQISIPRCYKPASFGSVVATELHHFSDASNRGYGQCSYVRFIDDQGRIHCSFVMGKARVAPLKVMTIPRLELTAAVISAKVSEVLKRELEYKITREVFWTDSKVVLGYIANEARRFHIFVANRIQQIRDNTLPSQWKYVDTKCNPADDASRGLSAKDLHERKSRWLNGPEFLWKDEAQWSSPEKKFADLSTSDPEVKKVVVFSVQTSKSYASILNRLEYFSDWDRAKRAFAICCKFKDSLRKKQVHQSTKGVNTRANSQKCTNFQLPKVEELQQAEIEIIKLTQEEAFGTEIEVLRSLKNSGKITDRNVVKERNRNIKKTSCLYRLDPFIDEDGIVRVGGRIKKANVPYHTKFPIILPRKSHVTKLITKYHHEKVKHQGRGMTLNEIRASGFWIIGGTSVVGNLISSCIMCRKQRGNFLGQKMADLPEDRLETAPPFTYCAVDYFGPWYVKIRRTEMKRYGVIFTCMASRAVHIEIADTMDTDSFINATRRFICRRGPIRQLRSDQGTNFVGAKNELKAALAEFDHKKICSELRKHNCDWFEFKMNVPHASHMGGVWERQIKTVRSVMSVLLHEHGTQLDDESLRTLMCEAESIVNSRPLTVENLNDPNSLSPLTPNHLLTMKTKIVLPPPGIFKSADKYSRKRWRRVQHLANEFWSRWKKEFLINLQQRQKWTRVERNVKIGDVVILSDNSLPRNRWQLARVVNTNQNKDGHVRTVRLVIGDSSLSSDGKRTGGITYLDRPVHKLILLITKEDQG